MTLLYDLKSTQSAIKGAEGGGEYSRAVFRRLVVLAAELNGPDGDSTSQRLAAFYHADHPLDSEVEELVRQYKIPLHPIRNLKDLQSLLSSGQFTTYMSGLSYSYHSLDFGQMVVFLTVHGLRPLEQRMPFHGRHYARGIAAKAKWLAKYSLERVRPHWRAGQSHYHRFTKSIRTWRSAAGQCDGQQDSHQQ